MFNVIIGLIFIACIFLILIVLVQNSKGGGLSSTFAGSNQFMGVQRTTDFLEKATWTLAGALLVLSLLASMTIDRNQGIQQQKSLMEQKVQSTPDAAAIPTIPQQPQQTTK